MTVTLKYVPSKDASSQCRCGPSVILCCLDEIADRVRGIASLPCRGGSVGGVFSDYKSKFSHMLAFDPRSLPGSGQQEHDGTYLRAERIPAVHDFPEGWTNRRCVSWCALEC